MVVCSYLEQGPPYMPTKTRWTSEQTLAQLTTWGACDLNKRKGTAKAQLQIAALEELEWVLCKIRGPALAEYEKIQGPAYAEYRKIEGPAYAEYQKISGPAYAAYQKIEGPAYAEYEKIQGPAYAKYQKIRAVQAHRLILD